MNNNATPAFPVLEFSLDCECVGLSKREYAAIHITPTIIEKFAGYDMSVIADIAVEFVDALFDRLEK